ncbi:hypothetical protein [Endozoicomonas sp. Mp262]|uniref:hypothetical protein n=1 Tax=Endozoicomonas sp. Mp262 TaxID=2919499 RepID=UPI0021DA8210
MTDSSTTSWKTRHFFRGLAFQDEMASLAEELSNSFYNHRYNQFDYHPDNRLVIAINKHRKDIKIQWQDFDWGLNQR